MKRFFYFAAVMVLLAACGPKNKIPKVTKINLSKTAITVVVGKTDQLVATVEPKEVTPQVTWTSSNESIATVTSNGTVRGIAEGTATITASQDGITSAPCTVTVTADPYENLVFTEWIRYSGNKVGTKEASNGKVYDLELVPIALITNNITVGTSKLSFEEGDNYLIWTYSVIATRNDTAYILGADFVADLEFWDREEETFDWFTFIPGIQEDTTFYGSTLEKLYVEDGEIVEETTEGLLTDGVYYIDANRVLPYYNLTVVTLNGNTYNYVNGTIPPDEAPSKIKGLAGKRIDASKLIPIDGFVKKMSNDKLPERLRKRFK